MQSPFNIVTLSAGIPLVLPNPNTNGGNAVPNAYLRMVFFDESGLMLSHKIVYLNATAKGVNWQQLYTEIQEAPANGRVEIFVANESDKSVWFDDLSITHEQHLIAQENHYYPFGMNMVGIEKRGMPEDRFQYNGKEKQSEFGLNWADYGARFYDNALGRWHGVDPLADKYVSYSPYNYVINNPLIFVDPDGKRIELPKDKDEKRQVRSVLRTLRRSSSTARKIIKDLKKSDNVHTISIISNTDGSVTNQKKDGTQGTNIQLNLDGNYGYSDNKDVDKAGVTAHELGHAWRIEHKLVNKVGISLTDSEIMKELFDKLNEKLMKNEEAEASHIANIVLGEFKNEGIDANLKQTYKGELIKVSKKEQQNGIIQNYEIPVIKDNYIYQKRTHDIHQEYNVKPITKKKRVK